MEGRNFWGGLSKHHPNFVRGESINYTSRTMSPNWWWLRAPESYGMHEQFLRCPYQPSQSPFWRLESLVSKIILPNLTIVKQYQVLGKIMLSKRSTKCSTFERKISVIKYLKKWVNMKIWAFSMLKKVQSNTPLVLPILSI